jgi:hypothetical protein
MLPNYPGAISTDFGTWIPGGQVVAYVHHNGRDNNNPEYINKRVYKNLPDALNKARASRNDIIVVLPGHAENVDAADDWANLVAGTTILGLGQGNLRPTFTWTTATSTVLLNVANVTISNLIFEMAGPDGATALTVTAPMTISAAGCTISNCRMRTGRDADQGSTIAITTTAAADDLTLLGNHIYDESDGTLTTTLMDIIGCDRLRMEDNIFRGTTSTATDVGVVRFATTASTNIILRRNVYMNVKALSTCAVTGLAGVTGVSYEEHFHYLDTSSLTPWVTNLGGMTFHRPTVTNTTAETGTETVGTVSG